MINATMPAATRMLAALPRNTHEKVAATTAAANADYLQWQMRKEVLGKLQMWDVVQRIETARSWSFAGDGCFLMTGQELARALQAGKPALLELRLDPEAISPNATLSSIRKVAQEKAERKT